MEVKKVSEERLQELRAIQNQYDVVTKRYGELTYELRSVERMMDDVEYHRINLIEVIQTEMGGPGTVDITTGEFTTE